MIGLLYGEKNNDDTLSRFHLVPERNGQTDGQTDRRTDSISISRVSMLTRDKNRLWTTCACLVVASEQESCCDSMPSTL